ncbi:hypothetical protein [Oenococcus kitaharae]|uniref:RepB family plasmid replication protein n=1 Tax=Oenococcus kitaharae DSM 17330 TaxID=1045004 RepID=G9WJV7_9LACO|nr:hypothetical protein [Oenococcus kitaharae]EHN58125.1 RepB family plasmid replication protein [Oenococcus kitaharae DSM 17330]OEY82409.1 hypothetical protein NV75_08365 [Oenococcus kitaharae]OEY82553.1 hypothetical protein NT95_06175 [Oenococcus kitaharae]OEY84204.1 hypothetical protein NT96_05320 [Oenococcus kitaharae]
MNDKSHTIKELADHFSKSKTAIRSALKHANISAVSTPTSTLNSALKYDDSALAYLNKKYGVKANMTKISVGDGQHTQQSNSTLKSANQRTISALIEQLDVLHEQLKVKDGQLSNKDKQIEELHTLLDQSQKLNLSDKKPALVAEKTNKKSLGFFKRLFGADNH